jgi:hypothetical protein
MITSNINKIQNIRGVSFIYTLKPSLSLLGLNPSSKIPVTAVHKPKYSNEKLFDSEYIKERTINLSLSDLERIDSYDIIQKEHQGNATNLLIYFANLLYKSFAITPDNESIINTYYGNQVIGVFEKPFISGYRSMLSNQNVGGAAKSKHLTGEALDFDLQYLDYTKVNVIKISHFILKYVYKIEETTLSNLFNLTQNRDRKTKAREPYTYTFKEAAYNRQELAIGPVDGFQALPKTFFIYEQQNFIHVDIREVSNNKIIFQAKEKPASSGVTVKNPVQIDNDND